MLRELEVNHSGLYHSALIFNVDFEDAVHARESDNDAALLRNRASTETGACPARDDGNILGRGQPYNLGNLFSVLRENYGAGRAFANAGIVFVQHQVFGTIKDSIASGNLAELIDKAGQVHRGKCSTAPLACTPQEASLRRSEYRPAWSRPRWTFRRGGSAAGRATRESRPA